jgi:hypothetical protein
MFLSAYFPAIDLDRLNSHSPTLHQHPIDHKKAPRWHLPIGRNLSVSKFQSNRDDRIRTYALCFPKAVERISKLYAGYSLQLFAISEQGKRWFRGQS